MLKLEDILNKMKTHFPRWMDIRRKMNSSTGGLYLTSIAEEIADIQGAIDDYKKDFFIDNYTGKEENILSFLYKVPIGIVDNIKDLILITPNYTITQNEDVFYDNDNYVYYNDGNLYFKKPENNILYAINGYKCEGTYEKIHVWNIFDEFAVFIGLRRYQNETNEELLKRIYSYSKNRVNSSSDGLKNAILSNLTSIAPKLKMEDIKIEKTTPENLVKYYNEYETILDHLSKVNKDVYKEKQWDIDTWNFSIKSIDYIPHAWDVALSEYLNGVGFKDDLKVEIIDANPITDVTIYFYKKTIEMLNDYIKNNNISKEFNMKLTKYNDEILNQNVKYRITAADAIKINPNDISFKSSEEKTGIINVNLEDVIKDDSELKVIDNSLLDENYNYIIDFIPTNEIGNFQINYCRQVKEDSSYTNLFRDSYPNFTTIGEGVKSSVSKKYIKELNQLSSYENIKKSINGFEVINLSKSAFINFEVNGLNGYNLFYDYDVKETILDLNNFKIENCYIYNNTIVSDTVTGEKTSSLDLIANSFSCSIEGPFNLQYTINNGDVVTISKQDNINYNFVIDKSNISKNIKLTIMLLDSNCKIKEVKYSRYDFEITTEKAALIDRTSYCILPNYDENNVIVKIRVYDGFSPVLKYIYIGSKLTDSNGYYGIEFKPENGKQLITKYENCRLQLKKYSKDSNELIDTIYDYKPYKEYTAVKDTKVIIDLDNFSVSSIDAGNCIPSNEVINNIKTIYYLTIPKDRSIISFSVSGKYSDLLIDQTLTSILIRKNISYTKYNFYVSKNESSLIAKNKTSEEIKYININYSDIYSDITSAKLFVNVGSNKIITKFMEGGINNYSSETINSFDYISFEPIESNLYYAINEYNVIFPQTKNIEIVNTFNNNFNINSKNSYFYTIESLNENFYVRFQTNDIIAFCDTKTLDSQNIVISCIDPDLLNYNFSTNIINVELPLSSSVEIPRKIYTEEATLDIRQYTIEMNNHINYSNKYIDKDNNLDYIFTEELNINSKRINKLKYCNVNQIEEVIYNDTKLTEKKDFEIILDKGIIVWINEDILQNEKVVITYNINVPISFNIELEDLYEQINYPINSLELLSTETLSEVKSNSSIDLNIYNNFAASDLVSIKCSTPGFISVINEGILTLTNNIPENSIAIKTGYYYLNGKEYYLPSDEKYDSIDKINSVVTHNVIQDNNSYILKMKSQNLITNSSFDLNTKGEIYVLDCKNKSSKGTSILNEISTCENFNYWNSFATELSIVDGYNGQALKFESSKDINGYCYLYLKDLNEGLKYNISFYLKGDCTAYLGKERNLNSKNIEFNYNSTIDIVSEIKTSGVFDNIFETEFTQDKNEKYFLILKGNGIIDDIIIGDESNYDIYHHIKNIDKLGFDFNETIYPEYVTRLYLNDKNGALFDGTEMNDEEQIFNSSYVHWGYTNIKTLSSYSDFNSCILENIDLLQYNNSGIIKTGSCAGSVTTYPIYIGNTSMFNKLLFKINDIAFNYMKGIKIKILTSASKNSGYKEIFNSTDVIGTIDNSKLLPYIKIILEIQPNMVINNIELFVEYISNEDNKPYPMEVTNGNYTTKVLDSQYSERYLIKAINIEDCNSDLNNYIFQIRATKQNDNNTVWTDWKTIEIDENHNITNRITFVNYRYFQVRVLLKGENTSLKIKNIDLEVI